MNQVIFNRQITFHTHISVSNFDFFAVGRTTKRARSHGRVFRHDEVVPIEGYNSKTDGLSRHQRVVENCRRRYYRDIQSHERHDRQGRYVQGSGGSSSLQHNGCRLHTSIHVVAHHELVIKPNSFIGFYAARYRTIHETSHSGSQCRRE